MNSAKAQKSSPQNALDHIVIAAKRLDDGIAYIEENLGVAPVAGGQHVKMGTHNALLSLGLSCYLEVIAVDPGLAPPNRPRWFRLDEHTVQERLQNGPFLHHWVVRTSDIETTCAISPQLFGPVTPMSRGQLEWLITIPADGSLPAGGILPSLIQWQAVEPSRNLPDQGLRLESLDITASKPEPVASVIDQLSLENRITVHAGTGDRLTATVKTPFGPKVLC